VEQWLYQQTNPSVTWKNDDRLRFAEGFALPLEARRPTRLLSHRIAGVRVMKELMAGVRVQPGCEVA